MIDILTNRKNITISITKVGKFSYNLFTMGIYTSGNIFQAKVGNLLGDIEDSNMYIDYIMVLIMENYPKCI